MSKLSLPRVRHLFRKAGHWSAAICAAASINANAEGGPSFHFPTANQALLEPGGSERFYVGTVGKAWTSGGFGCVRTEGWQFHEGLDVRCVQRDRRGEPTDPVLATADGQVAYVNRRSGLSNYGLYVIVRHQIQGLEVYSLYAHLREIRAGLSAGQQLKAGEPLGVLGRTTNTRQAISKDRAHVHFELNLLVNERFGQWYTKYHKGQRNDHGDWNGQNLLGLDPAGVFIRQAQEPNFDLLTFIQHQTELCRVQVRATAFPWLRRYPGLIKANPRAGKEGIGGYELALNFIGLPFEVIPRAPGEMKSGRPIQLLSVNELEQQAHPCGRLVTRRNNRWEMTSHGLDKLQLLLF